MALQDAIVQGVIKMRAETQRQLECLSRNCVPNEPLDQDDICGVGNSCWIPVRILLLTY